MKIYQLGQLSIVGNPKPLIQGDKVTSRYKQIQFDFILSPFKWPSFEVVI